MRLAFEVQLDFFNPNGTRKRGNHDSIGILSAALMNLDDDIRYKPDALYVSIIPGMNEPDVEEIPHYVRPLIDVFAVGWERGLHFSPTGRSSTGRDVDLAIIISVNDLPAARKISGTAGTSSHFFCTVCDCYHLKNVWNTDFQNWKRRDVNHLRQNAFAWRDAKTLAQRKKIFEVSGVRWSELWRLPYWNPTRMLVIDGMHCVLEGIVKYHCRYILRLDATIAKEKETQAAFSYDWMAYDPSKVAEDDLLSEKEESEEQVQKLQRKLQEAVVPLDTINLSQLKYIQRVISKTATPSWINSVPRNYGESSAGTIKADEWRTLATIYIPIALVLMWGDQPEEDAERLLAMLHHSMALFQAVTLVCRYSSSQPRADAYRQFIKEWVDGLITNHPHSSEHNARINIHAAFHIYDFILLFGPIMAWWCFPFERLIGALQRINKNNHIGGELEATIVKSFWRGANLRRYLNRADCPEVIKQFKVLFDLTFSPHNDRSTESVPAEDGKDRAHYTHQGVNYSRASAHLGNSLVLYYPSSNASSLIAGSIQCIETAGDDTIFHIRRQAPLPPGKFDPFLPYPHFPARTYSSFMEDVVDKVKPFAVISHCARFEFSDNRAVILNLSRVR
ncbi:hypothetical protein C8R44DRAFT_653822 [Mycena epipterygia]|nr:hypothetical protein C8R44DRAFT_653822 [Mycena epipterygia]